MNVLFIGCGYFPFRVSGDKNFFLQLLPKLSRDINITIMSVNDMKNVSYQEAINNQIKIYNISRPLHITSHKRFKYINGACKSYNHQHKIYQEIPEKFLSLWLNKNLLRNIIKKHKIEIVLFMENFGPAMIWVKKRFPKLYVCCVGMNYNPRSKLYNQYLRYCFGNIDKVIVYTTTYKQKLMEIGVNPQKVHMIRWGVNILPEEIASFGKGRIRRKYIAKPDKKMILWSGFIQQIQKADFMATIAFAKKFYRNHRDVEFVFALKPEFGSKKYLEQSSEGVKVISNIENFRNLLQSADIFLSPVLKTNSIVAPPLTWIEAMSYGLPILTTEVGGVDEIVVHNKTGFVVKDYKHLEMGLLKALATMKHKGEEIRRSCFSIVEKQYNINNAKNKYIKLFRSIQGNV